VFGEAMIIGGVKEKTFGAKRNCIERVFIPKANWLEYQQNPIDGMNVTSIETLEEMYRIIIDH
jgi:ATP-dependent Lon protease